MPIFKILDKELVVQVDVYKVEAATAEEARDMYINELAGSLEVDDTYYEYDTRKTGIFTEN